MKRRDFIKTTVALGFVPFFVPNFKKSDELRLEYSYQKDNFIPNQACLIKGNHKVPIYGIGDLRDVCNFCTTVTIADMTIAKLSIGKDGTQHDYENYIENKIVKVDLSSKEKAIIWSIFHILRGEHNCLNPKLFKNMNKFVEFHKNEPIIKKAKEIRELI